MISLKIEVTDENIKNGKPKSAYRCAVALALKNALPTYGVQVTGRHIAFIKVGHDSKVEESFRVETPQEVVDFIHKFDRNQPTNPFSFHLQF